MRVFAAAILLGSLGAAPLPAAAASWIGWDLRCDSQELRLADPGHAWRLLDGFSPIAVDHRIVEREAGALIVLAAPAARDTTIYVEARTDGKRADVAVELNRRSLGTGTVRKRLDTLAFPVPADAGRRGLNVLRLRRVAADAKKAPNLEVVRIGVGPLLCRGQDPAAIDVASEQPLVLSARSLVLAPLTGEDGSPDQVEVSLFARPNAAVSVSCWTEHDVVPLSRLTGTARGRVHTFLPLGEDCAAARGLAFLGEGPAPARDVRIEIDRVRGLGWRGRVRLQMVALFAVAVAAALAVAVRLRSRGGLEWNGSRPPWLDVGWVVFVALLPRIVFWVSYPAPGEAGDSFEYLLRAGFLLNGSADFWSDLDWHTWGHFIRPPGYFALLALFDAPSALGRMGVIGLQLVISALTAGLTYLLTLPLFGRLAAWFAGLSYALYVGAIATFTRILAEPIYIFLALAGLTAVAWLVKRPTWQLALAAGALFGLAALFRPGPIYYPPLAGLLLVPTLGWKKGLRTTGLLVLGLVAMVLPWSVRNSVVAGSAVGLETVSIANFLMTHPDEERLPLGGLDLTDGEDYAVYRARVHRLERSPLTTVKGPHVRRVLRKAARDPGAHLRRVGGNLRELLGPVPDAWLRWILREKDAIRLARLTTLVNVQYGSALVLGLVGFVAFLRRPRFWPVAAWFFFNTGLLTFFFYAVARYREPTTPVLMAFAGGAIAALVARLSVVKKSGLS